MDRALRFMIGMDFQEVNLFSPEQFQSLSRPTPTAMELGDAPLETFIPSCPEETLPISGRPELWTENNFRAFVNSVTRSAAALGMDLSMKVLLATGIFLYQGQTVRIPIQTFTEFELDTPDAGRLRIAGPFVGSALGNSLARFGLMCGLHQDTIRQINREAIIYCMHRRKLDLFSVAIPPPTRRVLNESREETITIIEPERFATCSASNILLNLNMPVIATQFIVYPDMRPIPFHIRAGNMNEVYFILGSLDSPRQLAGMLNNHLLQSLHLIKYAWATRLNELKASLPYQALEKDVLLPVQRLYIEKVFVPVIIEVEIGT